MFRHREVLEIAIRAVLIMAPASAMAAPGAGKGISEVKAPAAGKPVSQTDHSEKQAPPPPIRHAPAGHVVGAAPGGNAPHPYHPPLIVAPPPSAASKVAARKQLAPGGHLGVGGLRKAASFTEPVLIGVRDLTFYLHPDADDDGSLGELRILGPDGHLACGPTRDYCHLEASPGSEYTLVVRNIGVVTGFFSIELAGPREADIARKQTR